MCQRIESNRFGMGGLGKFVGMRHASQGNKGRDAAHACLRMIELKKQYQ